MCVCVCDGDDDDDDDDDDEMRVSSGLLHYNSYRGTRTMEGNVISAENFHHVITFAFPDLVPIFPQLVFCSCSCRL